MTIKDIFRGFILGQDVAAPYSFDSYEIGQAISQLDSGTLLSVCREAFELHQQSQKGLRPHWEGCTSPLLVDLDSGGLGFFAALIFKMKTHPLYTENLGVYLAQRLQLGWDYRVQWGDAWCPRVSAGGHLAFEYEGRLLELTPPGEILSPSEELDAFWACLEASWKKAAKESEFQGFVLHNAAGKLSFSTQWPCCINKQGQTLIGVPSSLAQAICHKLPSLKVAMESSSTGHVYVRQLGELVYLYGDGDMDEALSPLFESFARGFIKDPDVAEQSIDLLNAFQARLFMTHVVAEKVQMWVEDSLDVYDLSPVSEVLQGGITQLVSVLEAQLTENLVPFFDQAETHLPRASHQQALLNAVGLEPGAEHPCTDVFATNLAFLAQAYEQGQFARALKERLAQLHMDLVSVDLPGLRCARLFIARNEEDCTSNPTNTYLELGDILQASDESLESALRQYLTQAGYYAHGPMDEDEAFQAWTQLMHALIVVQYAAPQSWQSSLQIAENFSEFGSATLVSGRLPLSAFCENFNQIRIWGIDVFEEFECLLYDDTAKSEYVARYDNDDGLSED